MYGNRICGNVAADFSNSCFWCWAVFTRRSVGILGAVELMRTRVVSSFLVCKGEKSQREEISYLWKTQRIGKQKGFAWLPNLQTEFTCQCGRIIYVQHLWQYSEFQGKRMFLSKDKCFLVTFNIVCQHWVSFIFCEVRGES